MRFATADRPAAPGPSTAQRTTTTIPRPEPPPADPDAPAGRDALDALLRTGTYTADDLDALADAHPRYWLPIIMLAAATRFATADLGDVTRRQLRTLFEHAADPVTHPFFALHLAPESRVVAPVAPDVSVELPFSRDAVGLMLADLHREQQRFDLAVDVLERLGRRPAVALSLAELYCRTDRNGDVIRLTNDVQGSDDASALLLVYRGIACTRTGMFEAARQAFNAVLARRNRAPQVRHHALRHRAELHVSVGNVSHARRDLERILADDPADDAARRRLDELTRD